PPTSCSARAASVSWCSTPGTAAGGARPRSGRGWRGPPSGAARSCWSPRRDGKPARSRPSASRWRAGARAGAAGRNGSPCSTASTPASASRGTGSGGRGSRSSSDRRAPDRDAWRASRASWVPVCPWPPPRASPPPSCARLAAKHGDGTEVVPAGVEQGFLAPLPLTCLGPPPEIASTLQRWGVHRLGDLARLPAAEVATRLGPAGAALVRAARGIDERPLAPEPLPAAVEEALALEYALANPEPLLFVLRGL